ncbi:hypothetical protein C8A03DRAFT_38503 [Achaetomium macrosporum]|uniref:Uncharacterized protein n=1 Tax=Achaetomium macrosporum TaxID=79813 RepID=A0AAN7HAF4_9PEZI|nr:hypothetical protein C8A03DRAFT_38503 [Achaetomium macrosporum]
MPRAARNTVDDPEISIRLKYGIHTIFLFAMVDWTFSRLTTELLSILRDRYPDGLTASIDDPEKTSLPASDDDIRVAYALPKNANDLSQGWKSIRAKLSDTLGKKGLTDTCSVAFALLDPSADEDDVKFQVELPTLEDEEA